MDVTRWERKYGDPNRKVPNYTRWLQDMEKRKPFVFALLIIAFFLLLLTKPL